MRGGARRCAGHCAGVAAGGHAGDGGAAEGDEAGAAIRDSTRTPLSLQHCSTYSVRPGKKSKLTSLSVVHPGPPLLGFEDGNLV